MQVSSQKLAKVEHRLNKQNALGAAVAGGLWEPVCDELNTGKFEYSFIREYQSSSR